MTGDAVQRTGFERNPTHGSRRCGPGAGFAGRSWKRRDVASDGRSAPGRGPLPGRHEAPPSCISPFRPRLKELLLPRFGPDSRDLRDAPSRRSGLPTRSTPCRSIRGSVNPSSPSDVGSFKSRSVPAAQWRRPVGPGEARNRPKRRYRLGFSRSQSVGSLWIGDRSRSGTICARTHRSLAHSVPWHMGELAGSGQLRIPCSSSRR